MTPNILADFTNSKALPLASRETVSKSFFLRKSILSSLHLSEFSLNLLSLDHQRTSCTVSWSTEAPNLGTISETLVSSANFQMEIGKRQRISTSTELFNFTPPIAGACPLSHAPCCHNKSPYTFSFHDLLCS